MNLVLPKVEKRVFLILGKECNATCVYCHQGNGKVMLPVTPCAVQDMPDPKVVAGYFRSLPDDFQLTLYGGEPMLYWSFLERFLTEFRMRYPVARLSMITNGTLLNPGRVKTLNEHKVTVNLSHDGPYHKMTRRYPDFLKTHPELFLSLDQKGVAAVCSSAGMDFYAFWDYFDDFANRNQVTFPIYIQMIKDVSDNTNTSLFMSTNEQKAQFETMLDKVFDNLYKALKSEDYSGHEWEQYRSWVYRLNSIVNGGIPVTLPCKEDIAVVDIDVFGNLYRCHNIAQSFGHVDELGLMASDSRYQPSGNCRGCPYYLLCGGLCYVADKSKFDHMCYLMQEQAKRVIELLDKLRGEIKC